VLLVNYSVSHPCVSVGDSYCWLVTDSIEANIECASVNVVRGSEHIRQARSHQVIHCLFTIPITFYGLLCFVVLTTSPLKLWRHFCAAVDY